MFTSVWSSRYHFSISSEGTLDNFKKNCCLKFFPMKYSKVPVKRRIFTCDLWTCYTINSQCMQINCTGAYGALPVGLFDIFSLFHPQSLCCTVGAIFARRESTTCLHYISDMQLAVNFSHRHTYTSQVHPSSPLGHPLCNNVIPDRNFHCSARLFTHILLAFFVPSQDTLCLDTRFFCINAGALSLSGAFFCSSLT